MKLISHILQGTTLESVNFVCPKLLGCFQLQKMTDPTDTSFFGDIFGEAGTTKTFEAKNVEVSERPEVAFQPEIQEEPIEEKVSEEVQSKSLFCVDAQIFAKCQKKKHSLQF